MRILVTDGMDKTAMAELKAQGHEVVEQFYEPATNKALYSHPMVSCTPHIGAATVEAQKRIGAEIVDIISKM